MVNNSQHMDDFLKAVFEPGSVFYPQSREIGMDSSEHWHAINVYISGTNSNGMQVAIRLNITAGISTTPSHPFFEALLHTEAITVTGVNERPDTVCFQYSNGSLFLHAGGLYIPLSVTSARHRVEPVDNLSYMRGMVQPVYGYGSQIVELDIDCYLSGMSGSEYDGKPFVRAFVKPKKEKKEKKRPARKLTIPGVSD